MRVNKSRQNLQFWVIYHFNTSNDYDILISLVSLNNYLSTRCAEWTMIQTVILFILNVNTKIVTSVHKSVILKASRLWHLIVNKWHLKVFKNINNFHSYTFKRLQSWDFLKEEPGLLLILRRNFLMMIFSLCKQHINDKNIISRCFTGDQLFFLVCICYYRDTFWINLLDRWNFSVCIRYFQRTDHVEFILPTHYQCLVLYYIFIHKTESVCFWFSAC